MCRTSSSLLLLLSALIVLPTLAQENERHGQPQVRDNRRPRTHFRDVDVSGSLNLPRWTSCSNSTNAYDGDICYDVTDQTLKIRSNSTWIDLLSSITGADSITLNADADGDDTGKYQLTPIDNSEGRQLDQKGYDDASSGPFHSYPWPEVQIWNPRQASWTRPTHIFVVDLPDYTEYPSETEWEGAWPTGDASSALRLIANRTRQAGTYAGISLELEGDDPANTAPHETVSIWGAKAYDRQAQFVVRMQTDFDEDGTLDRSDYGYPDRTFPQSPFNNLLGTATGDDMRDLPWVTMRLSQAYDSRIDSADPNWSDVRPGAGDHGAGVWFVFKDLAPEPSYSIFYPQQYSSIALVPDYDACNPDVDGDSTLEETTQFAFFTEEFHSPISLGSNYESFHLCLFNIPDKRSNDTIHNQWTFDIGLITSSIISETGETLVLDSANGTVRMPDYTTCNIETDANGNLVCGVDDTGGTGGSPSGGSGAVQLSDGIGSFDHDVDGDGTTDLRVSGGNKLYLDTDTNGVMEIGNNTGVPSSAWSANHRKNRIDLQIPGGGTTETEVRYWYDAQSSTTTGNGRVMKTLIGSKDYFIELDRFDYGFDYGFDYTAGFGVSHPNSTDLVLYAPSIFGENTNTKMGSDADVDGDGTVDRWDEIHARIAKFTEQLFITDQTNCDSVDTNASGELICGTDSSYPSTGSSGHVQLSDGSSNFTNDTDGDGTADISFSGNTLYVEGGSGACDDSLSLGGAAAASYMRRDSATTVTVQHTFSAGLKIDDGDAIVFYDDLFGTNASWDIKAGSGQLEIVPDASNAQTTPVLAIGSNSSSTVLDGSLGLDNYRSCTNLASDSGGNLSCSTDDDVPESGDFGNANDLDSNGDLLSDTVGTAELNDGANTPTAGDCVKVASGGTAFEYGTCGGGGVSTLWSVTLLDPSTTTDLISCDGSNSTCLVGPRMDAARTLNSVYCYIDPDASGRSINITLYECSFSPWSCSALHSAAFTPGHSPTAATLTDTSLASGNVIAIDINSADTTINQLQCTWSGS